MRQWRPTASRPIVLVTAAALGLTLIGALPASADDGRTADREVVATGLDNPRQLSFSPSGDLLIAEAGTGGDGPCVAGPEGPDDQVCFGTTGAITQVDRKGRQSRIITGLPSLAGAGGGSASGPSDVAAVGRRLAILIGLGADPARRAELGDAGRQLGTLVQTTRQDGRYRTIADLAAWEGENNPVADPDSNPVGLAIDCGDFLVADAGGNTVLRVSGDDIDLEASFPDRPVDAPADLGLPPGTQIPMQAVPTSVAVRGYDGAVYVSQLTGFPFPTGAANIYRIGRDGNPVVWASGLTNVTDLAFDGRTLYAVQLTNDGLLSQSSGSVVRVDRGSTSPTVVAGDLSAPYGIAIRRGSAYVTTGALLAGGGEVVRIRL